MLRLFLCLILCCNPLQSEHPASFYIKVEANTEYHSRYIFSRTDIIPEDKLFPEGQTSAPIECLVEELKAAGIYDHVEAELQFTDEEKVRILLLDTALRQDIEEVTISRVQVVGFPEIDTSIFQKVLLKKGVKPNLPFFRFSFNQLEEKVRRALIAAYPRNKLKEDEDRSYLLSFRPDGDKNVMLVVTSGYLGCK
ncbi:MAG: hypothetical protein HY774_02520 [Acidobacteria bacterium]|nr:hypothetical protein [Acidobacteriota bacterium]